MMKARKLCALIFLGVIMFSMFWVFYSYVTKKISIPKDEVKIDWAKLYTFEAQNIIDVQKQRYGFKKIYSNIKHAVEEYTSTTLKEYIKFVEFARQYEDILNWNMTSISIYNPVVKLQDDYLSDFTKSRDVSENVKMTVDFSKWCKEKGINFFYVNMPSKNCKYEDENISGILDFSNQNADRFLRDLKENGVRYYDLRKNLHDDGMNHHDAFFKTDHHWKPETGLWAAKHILGFLRDDYGWNVNPEILNPENFDSVIYPECFLGSEGKKFTLLRAKPEDISLIYPKYKTQLKFEVPTKGINVSGDFAITYDMEKVITSKDFYETNPYAAYKYGDRALSITHNFLSDNDKKILIVHDSFSNSLIPFLALGVRQIDDIDLRHFTGSLRTYINSTKPDIIILGYHTAVISTFDSTSNKFYDFR